MCHTITQSHYHRCHTVTITKAGFTLSGLTRRVPCHIHGSKLSQKIKKENNLITQVQKRVARDKRERANSVDDEVASVVSQASDNDKEVTEKIMMMIPCHDHH